MLRDINKYIGAEALIPTIGVIVLSAYYYYYRENGKKYPPGPKGLPVLGCVTQLGNHPAKTLTALSKEYGPIFSVQVGQRNWVVLNDYDSIFQALMKKGDDFSGRPNLHLLIQMGEGLGVIFADSSPANKVQRKFAISTMRKFGVGTQRLEDLVLEEVQYMSDEIQSKDGRGVDVVDLFTKAAGNTINKIVLGNRLPYDDPTYCKLIACLDRIFINKETSPQMLAMIIAPVTRFLPAFRDTYRGFCDDLEITFGILEKILTQHHQYFNDNDIRCFVDEFIKTKKSGKAHESFQDRQVFQFMRELFVAGSVNISTVLRWQILILARHPEYQEKIYNEIENVIGDNPPSMKQHRSQMPFTNAFILEVYRHRTFVPLSMPHCTTTKTSLNEYEIPKGTPVFVNLWSVHNDPNFFPDPEEFRPERYLDSEGKFVPDIHVIPYSLGPRTCLGDLMARVELFMYLTAIIQRFKIVPDPRKPLPELDDGINAIISIPPEFDVIFQNR